MCGEPAHTKMLEALLESCLSKNSRLRAPQSSTDVQPNTIMEEWKVASFKEHHEAVSGSVFTDTDKLLGCSHPISQEEK